MVATGSLSANDITLNGTGAVNFNAALVGSGNIIKNGSGILTVNAASTKYSGSFTLLAGQTVITADGALGNTAGGHHGRQRCLPHPPWRCQLRHR